MSVRRWMFFVTGDEVYRSLFSGAAGRCRGDCIQQGISEDSPWIREQVCSRMKWCERRLNAAGNHGLINRQGRISTDDSRLHAFVVLTEEALMLAHQVVRHV
jgi:acetate kinase